MKKATKPPKVVEIGKRFFSLLSTFNTVAGPFHLFDIPKGWYEGTGHTTLGIYDAALNGYKNSEGQAWRYLDQKQKKFFKHLYEHAQQLVGQLENFAGDVGIEVLHQQCNIFIQQYDSEEGNESLLNAAQDFIYTMKRLESLTKQIKGVEKSIREYSRRFLAEVDDEVREAQELTNSAKSDEFSLTNRSEFANGAWDKIQEAWEKSKIEGHHIPARLRHIYEDMEED